MHSFKQMFRRLASDVRPIGGQLIQLNQRHVMSRHYNTLSMAINEYKVMPKIEALNWCHQKRYLSLHKLDKHSSDVYLINKPTGHQKKLLFVDNENQLAFKTIEALIAEETVDFRPEVVQTNDSFNDIINKFLSIPPEEYQQYSSVCNHLVRNLKSLNLRQLMVIMKSMVNWPILSVPFDPVFYKLWSNLDYELDERLSKDQFIDNKDLEKYLLFGNMFYRLKTANICKFNDSLVERLSSTDFDLNKTSFLHLLFYVNLHRQVDPKISQYIVKLMETLMDDLTLDEMAVFCMTSFKSQIKLTDNIVKAVISKSISGVSDETNNIMRTAITKCIRLSYRYRFQPEFRHYINQMKQLSTNSEMSLSHLMNLSYTSNVYDEQLMDHTFDKLYNNMQAFRLKDIERIFLCLSNFGQQLDPKKLQFICDELHSKADQFGSYHYPICLLNIIHYLAILQFYPKKLIEHCFEPHFLAKITKYSKLDFQRHLLLINTALSIEKSGEFSSILLEPSTVYRYHQWILTEEKQSMPHMTRNHTLLNSVYMALKSELNQRVQLTHILPFRSYPFAVIWGSNHKYFALNATTELKPNMFKGCVAIYLLDIKAYLDVDQNVSKLIKGSVRLEMRLLESLGFTVVPIPWHYITRFITLRAKSNAVMKEVAKYDTSFANKINNI